MKKRSTKLLFLAMATALLGAMLPAMNVDAREGHPAITREIDLTGNFQTDVQCTDSDQDGHQQGFIDPCWSWNPKVKVLLILNIEANVDNNGAHVFKLPAGATINVHGDQNELICSSSPISCAGDLTVNVSDGSLSIYSANAGMETTNGGKLYITAEDTGSLKVEGSPAVKADYTGSDAGVIIQNQTGKVVDTNNLSFTSIGSNPAISTGGSSSISIDVGQCSVKSPVGQKPFSVSPIWGTHMKAKNTSAWDNIQGRTVSYERYVSVKDITGIPAETFIGTLNLSNKSQVVSIDSEAPKTKDITWSIKDAGTTGATLNNKVLNTTAVGDVTLTATIKDGVYTKTDYTKDITIKVNYQPVTGITLKNDIKKIYSAKDIKLETNILPEDATMGDSSNITWSIVDDKNTGASLGEDGIFLPGRGGIVKVRATIKDGTAVGIDFVKDFDIPVSQTTVEDIIWSGATTEFIGSRTLDCSFAPDSPSYSDIEWSVTDPGTTGAYIVAFKDNKGKNVSILNTINDGTVKLLATIKHGITNNVDFEKEFTYTVQRIAVTDITLTDVPSEIPIGYTTLNATVTPENATGKHVSYRVLDAGTTGAVIQDSKFLLTNAAGTVKIQATVKDGIATGTNFTKEFVLTVTPNAVVPNPGGTPPTPGTTPPDNNTPGTDKKEETKDPTSVKAVGKFTSGDFNYEILDKKNKTVRLAGFKKGKSSSTLNVKSTVTYKKTTYKITQIGNKAFYKNSKLKKVTISGNVLYIGKNAFDGCSKLTDVSIGNKTKAIYDSAFYNCKKLKNVTIGTGLNSIASKVFYKNTSLRKLVIKSKSFNKIGKKNLYNCKDVKIQVPSAKVKAYAKLFKSQGQKSNVKVTK